MKTRLIVDIEANGFLDKVDTIWCIVAKSITTGEFKYFSDQLIGPHEFNHFIEPISNFIDILNEYPNLELVMHNGIRYDIPVLEKLYNIKIKNPILDTYILSLYLDKDRFGGHSLKEW